MNVEANDSAKNASTLEQIDTTIASAIIATIDSAGFEPIASSASRGTSTCTAPASAEPMTSAGMTARSSITNCARLRRPRPPGSCATSSHVVAEPVGEQRVRVGVAAVQPADEVRDQVAADEAGDQDAVARTRTPGAS